MSIEGILAGKGGTVVTITPDVALAEAAALLHRHRIGAIVVLGTDEGVAGILSERDIVKAVAEDGVDALKAPVSTRMTAEVVTCGPTASVNELMSMMTERKFRHVPVVVSGRLRGIVSIGDLVKYRIAEIESEHQAMRDYITAG